MATRTTIYVFLSVIVCLIYLNVVEGRFQRCFSCRSRGRLGDCKDPFKGNATHPVPGVEAVPCVSGWCSKIIEGKKDGEDHDLAMERQCLQRSPPDDKQRCAEALVKNKKVFICFCQGDLCNSSSGVGPSYLMFMVASVLFLFNRQQP
ncbi:UPAR/Ly6 domain-containing protein rtv [Palaemon carinicauda]|uniref:UPAR/Ly6 domain-containing protein rtv n=1 Tax=Palaemon carinicauda TaxID=392227 RepID=UPI0035B66E0D